MWVIETSLLIIPIYLRIFRPRQLLFEFLWFGFAARETFVDGELAPDGFERFGLCTNRG